MGLTRTLALELAPDQITVVSVSPGPFVTDMNTALIENPEINRQILSRVTLSDVGKPEEVGKLTLFLCSDDASFIRARTF